MEHIRKQNGRITRLFNITLMIRDERKHVNCFQR